ncbi:MAG: hypothetical protein EXX96DRAFT_489610, partial [Benjaminiella poitrasii]
EALKGPHSNRIAARQKLAKLSNLQFHELSMDVYDEVMRRNKNDKFIPFLPVKEEFHPKRNQARQKLATLPLAQFQDLASDVYTELTRRYASLTSKDNNDHPPVPQIPSTSSKFDIKGNMPEIISTQPQPSKSTNIIPVKGMITVEENISDDDDEANSNSPSTPTFNSANSLLSSTIMKDSKDYFNHNAISSNESLTNDQHKEKGSSKEKQELLEKVKIKEQESQKSVQHLEEEYQNLSKKYKKLESEYNQQQEAVRDVKREAKQLLDELKRLAQINEELLAEKEESENKIEALKGEVKEWQVKYDKATIELRNVKGNTQGKKIRNAFLYYDMIKENFLQPTSNGIVPQVYILKYQAYLDDLLSMARSNRPAEVIDVMKNIVSVCRSITEEVERRENNLTTETKKSLYELKSRFSTSLSDLLVASRHHASGMGLSPVSLLDRSAGHLTAVIVDLAKMLGMNSSPSLSNTNSIKMANNNVKVNSSGYYNKSYTLNKNANQNTNLTPNELVKYLKSETDNIVETIKNLLAVLRLLPSNNHYSQQNEGKSAFDIISSILKIVATISELTRATCQTIPQAYVYQKDCGPLLNRLNICSQQISIIQTKYFSPTRSVTITAQTKRDLAKEAYEIAKITKDLITLFEEQ